MKGTGKEKKMDLIGKFEGFTIYAVMNEAKRNGKDRVWIKIKHDKPKEWRMSHVLATPHTAAISFEKEGNK